MPNHVQRSARTVAPAGTHGTAPTIGTRSMAKSGEGARRRLNKTQAASKFKDSKRQLAQQERDAKRKAAREARDAKRQAAAQAREARLLAAEIKQKESDDRFTPRFFIRAVEKSFGKIDFDPCWHEASAVRPTKYLDVRKGHNGLRDKWSGPLAFVNPPWSKQDKFVKRAHDEWRKCNVKTVLCLVPAAVGTAFFHSTLAKDANVFLIEGRPRFSKIDGSSQSTMVNTMLIAFGATDQQRARFAELVRGAWWVPEDLLSICVESTRVHPFDEFARFSLTSCSALHFDGDRAMTVFCGPPVGKN